MDKKYMYSLAVLAVLAGFGVNPAQSAIQTTGSGHAVGSAMFTAQAAEETMNPAFVTNGKTELMADGTAEIGEVGL